MPVPPPVEEFHPMMIQTLTKLVASVTAIVIALVATLYTILRQTDKNQQDQLDAGQDEFTNHQLELERIKKDIQSVREWVTELEADLDLSELKRLKDHESFLLLKDHHKRNHGEPIE